MLDKELCELLDAISREKGDPMSPFEELLLLGYYQEFQTKDESEDNEEDYEDYIQEEESSEEVDEEYEFDEDDEEYRLLNFILLRNNDRKKYFA